MYLSIYHDHNKHYTREFAAINEAAGWLSDLMPDNTKARPGGYLNGGGFFVEFDLTGVVDDESGKDSPVLGWVIDLDWEEPE